jgi:DNA-binding MarR family transcriptional regulator
MQARAKRIEARSGGRQEPDLEERAGLDPMLAVKLWRNPCWLSFRVNYIAHHFNQPLYAHIQRRYKLTPPEHVVLYAIGLKEGITAEEIAASSARPKNTLSRAVNALVAKSMVFRLQDRGDRRRLSLYLTRTGRRIVAETVPLFVAQEQAMAAALTPSEQSTLRRLLTKLILNKNAWPTTVNKETSP